MKKQIELEAGNRADNPVDDRERDDGTHEVAPDLAYRRLAIVNVVFYGSPGAGDREWILIDTGIPGTSRYIIDAAEERFGPDSRPRAIIMTHGHFDHAGTLEELADRWQAPVYAHDLELPYLNGTSAYPPPDPTVGGGIMSLLSPLYPRGPVNVSKWLKPLPADGSVPGMPDWKWISVPGHTPGQVALWRESDRSLIAADAFITTKQESAYAALAQEPKMHGPPMYYTQNWQEAQASVERLAVLEPELVITGHGRAMRGPGMRVALHALADKFEAVAIPDHGRYVTNPTSAQTGTAYVPAHKS